MVWSSTVYRKCQCATQALYTNTGYQLKRGEEEDLGLHGETQYEGHEPDECDVG